MDLVSANIRMAILMVLLNVPQKGSSEWEPQKGSSEWFG